jgi:hypothetical protein
LLLLLFAHVLNAFNIIGCDCCCCCRLQMSFPDIAKAKSALQHI